MFSILLFKEQETKSVFLLHSCKKTKDLKDLASQKGVWSAGSSNPAISAGSSSPESGNLIFPLNPNLPQAHGGLRERTRNVTDPSFSSFFNGPHYKAACILYFKSFYFAINDKIFLK